MQNVLVLNATYEVLAVVSKNRAIVLVLADKAEVLEQDDDPVRSCGGFEVPSPKVIRLTRFVKVPYRARLPLTRKALIARDEGVCQYCGKTVGNAGTIDHIHPRSLGGAHDWLNVALACRPCNGKKDSKTLDQLGWKLRSQPHVPHGVRYMIVGIAKVDPAWEPYLAMV